MCYYSIYTRGKVQSSTAARVIPVWPRLSELVELVVATSPVPMSLPEQGWLCEIGVHYISGGSASQQGCVVAEAKVVYKAPRAYF